MSEVRLPELKRIKLKEFWRQFRNKGCAGFVIPGHEPSAFHLAPIDDGWLSAMGTAVALTLRSSRPLLAKIYFDKEVKPEDIIYGVLLAMGLYYAAIEEHRDFYFKFTQEDWLQVRLDADTYGVHDNVFGTSNGGVPTSPRCREPNPTRSGQFYASV
ncbi:hypothetical protein JCM16303_003219 [Sporobolomyces ruberrimus]